MEQRDTSSVSPFYEAQLRQQYRLLGHEGHHTQGRCINLNENKIVSQKLLKSEDEVVSWSAAQNGKGNVFIGRAPRNAQGGVCGASCLSIDIDPIRAKGEAATEVQHKEALDAGKLVAKQLDYGVVGSSGNGALVLFPLGKFVDKESAEKLGRVLEDEARRLIQEAGLSEKVTVDSTWDCARLCKAMGTLSVKGDARLWRHARFITNPSIVQAPPEGFIERLEQVVQAVAARSSNQQVALGVEKGELDRSKADIALANRLKLEGFGPEDVLRSLKAYSMRPDREDDHRRIIQKVFFNQGEIKDLVNEKQIKLWTPINGADGYNERRTGGRTGSDLTTGIASLDRLTRGIPRTSILTVGARTDCGKTAFAIGAAYANCRAGKRVLYFSTENEYTEIWDRYFATATGISAYRIQDHKLDGFDRERFEAFSKDFSTKHQFAVYDGSRPSIADIRRAVEDFKPDLIGLDYFQHFEQKDARLLAEFVVQVHELVREKKIGCLMTAMAHDRWDLKTRKPLPISMGDIKDCHTIQDESRTVVLLDWDRDGVVGDGSAAVKCVLAKNKGPRDTLVLKLNRTIPRFEEDINARSEPNQMLQMPEAVSR